VDAAQDYLQRRHSQGRQAAPVVRHSGIVLVQNNTGSDLDLRALRDGEPQNFRAAWVRL